MTAYKPVHKYTICTTDVSPVTKLSNQVITLIIYSPSTSNIKL